MRHIFGMNYAIGYNGRFRCGFIPATGAFQAVDPFQFDLSSTRLTLPVPTRFRGVVLRELKGALDVEGTEGFLRVRQKSPGKWIIGPSGGRMSRASL
jgi:hypothetical protein